LFIPFILAQPAGSNFYHDRSMRNRFEKAIYKLAFRLCLSNRGWATGKLSDLTTEEVPWCSDSSAARAILKNCFKRHADTESTEVKFDFKSQTAAL
jgi:hypothetical protein